MSTKAKKTDFSDVIEYLKQIENDPREKTKFNQSIKRAAEKEKRRPGGEFSALFMGAIRIP